MKTILLTVLLSALTPVLAHAWTFNDLHDFTGSDGESPVDPSSLTLGADGNYYGVAFQGGSAGYGTIYKMTITGTQVSPSVSFSVLHHFADGSVTNDGKDPEGSMVQDTAGNFYGLTSGGGSHGYGTVFKLSLSGGVWTESVIYNFGGTLSDGRYGSGALAIDNSGSTPILYGTTSDGGIHAYGTIFKLTLSGGVWSETLLYAFNDLSSELDAGTIPAGPLLLASDGNLYGMTLESGLDDGGTVYQLKLSTGTVTSIYNFPFGNNVEGNGLAEAPSSGGLLKFFGTATFGGTHSDGVIFSLTQTTSGGTTFTHSTVYNFAGGTTDGAQPYGTLLISSDNGGSFYGTTRAGGSSNGGMLFNITYSGTPSYTTLLSLTYGPLQGVIWANIGGSNCLMGTSEGDGINSKGFVWEAYPN